MVRLFGRDVHDLAGSYAIDAIDDPAERARFEKHLRHCPQCATEVAGLSETATRLAFAASQAAPAQLRERVLADISRTRQLPPVAEQHPVHATPRPRTRTRPQPRLAWAFASACVAAVIVLAVVLVNTQGQLNQARTSAAKISAVLAAPDAHAVTMSTTAGGSTTVVYSHTRHSLVVTSAGLPPPPPGKVYELWLLGPPRVRPEGLMLAQRGGPATPVLITGLVKGDRVGMTVEPAPGTKQPTTTPIVDIALPV